MTWIIRRVRRPQAKLNIKSAYCIVPVHPRDRQFLGIQWKGKLFINAAPRFGLRSVSKLFKALAVALEWVMLTPSTSVDIPRLCQLVQNYLKHSLASSTLRSYSAAKKNGICNFVEYYLSPSNRANLVAKQQFKTPNNHIWCASFADNVRFW